VTSSEAADAENSSVALIPTTRDAHGGLGWGLGIAAACWLVMPTDGCPQGPEPLCPGLQRALAVAVPASTLA